MMWSKEDSKNLASIADSLAKLVDRERERNLITEQPSNTPFLDRIKKHMRPIKVSEGSTLEDESLEEEIKTTQRLQNKLAEAHREGNSPFFAEALLDEDELESLQ